MFNKSCLSRYPFPQKVMFDNVFVNKSVIFDGQKIISKLSGRACATINL